jgi:hypothetical protein
MNRRKKASRSPAQNENIRFNVHRDRFDPRKADSMNMNRLLQIWNQ